MNYLDANHSLERRDRSLASNRIEKTDSQTPPAKGVSLLVRITVGYFENGNYGRFAVLSGKPGTIIYAWVARTLRTFCRNV